jgi:hypothetical protein
LNFTSPLVATAGQGREAYTAPPLTLSPVTTPTEKEKQLNNRHHRQPQRRLLSAPSLWQQTTKSERSKVTARPGGRPTLRQSADEDALSSRGPKPPALPSPLAAIAGQRRDRNRTREATAAQILLEGLD